MSQLTIEHSSRNWIETLLLALSRFVTNQKLKAQIRRERQVLSGLDDNMLKDIGISRADAYYEASRPDSDIPANRR